MIRQAVLKLSKSFSSSSNNDDYGHGDDDNYDERNVDGKPSSKRSITFLMALFRGHRRSDSSFISIFTLSIIYSNSNSISSSDSSIIYSISISINITLN